MRNSIFLIIVLSGLKLSAQSLTLAGTDKLKSLFKSDSTLVIVNAWATWCKPCMEEMPMFAKADSVYKNRVSFRFISFDFLKDTARVKRTITGRQIPGEHYISAETDMNVLINRLDSSWGGSLPATWFCCNGRCVAFYESFEHFEQLEGYIKQLFEINNR